MIDQNLPAALASWLRNKEHEADHVLQLGLSEADDIEILREALRRRAIVVSKDSDFVVHHRENGVQVVWVRIGNVTQNRLIEVWERAWPDMKRALESGERLVELQR